MLLAYLSHERTLPTNGKIREPVTTYLNQIQQPVQNSVQTIVTTLNSFTRSSALCGASEKTETLKPNSKDLKASVFDLVRGR